MTDTTGDRHNHHDQLRDKFLAKLKRFKTHQSSSSASDFARSLANAGQSTSLDDDSSDDESLGDRAEKSSMPPTNEPVEQQTALGPNVETFESSTDAVVNDSNVSSPTMPANQSLANAAQQPDIEPIEGQSTKETGRDNDKKDRDSHGSDEQQSVGGDRATPETDQTRNVSPKRHIRQRAVQLFRRAASNLISSNRQASSTNNDATHSRPNSSPSAADVPSNNNNNLHGQQQHHSRFSQRLASFALRLHASNSTTTSISHQNLRSSSSSSIHLNSALNGSENSTSRAQRAAIAASAASATHPSSSFLPKFIVPKTNALNLPIVCLIRSLDGELMREISIHRFELGEYLIENIKASLGLRDAKYFGLRLAKVIDDQEDVHVPWLELNESVYKQVSKHKLLLSSSSSSSFSLSTSSHKSSNNTTTTSNNNNSNMINQQHLPATTNKFVNMYLRIKFYPPNLARVQDPFLKQYLWLQLKRDLRLGKLTSSMNNLTLLMACILQYELGDYKPELIDKLPDLNILPNQDLIEEQALEYWRTKLINSKRHQVQMQFLRAAVILETYGFDFYPVRDHQRQRAYLLGFNYNGIKTIRNGRVVHHFRWHNINTISHERRMIIFHIYPTENSKRKQILGFKCLSIEDCQNLYIRLLEQRYFFTVDLAYFDKSVRRPSYLEPTGDENEPGERINRANAGWSTPSIDGSQGALSAAASASASAALRTSESFESSSYWPMDGGDSNNNNNYNNNSGSISVDQHQHQHQHPHPNHHQSYQAQLIKRQLASTAANRHQLTTSKSSSFDLATSKTSTQGSFELTDEGCDDELDLLQAGQTVQYAAGDRRFSAASPTGSSAYHLNHSSMSSTNPVAPKAGAIECADCLQQQQQHHSNQFDWQSSGNGAVNYKGQMGPYNDTQVNPTTGNEMSLASRLMALDKSRPMSSSSMQSDHRHLTAGASTLLPVDPDPSSTPALKRQLSTGQFNHSDQQQQQQASQQQTRRLPTPSDQAKSTAAPIESSGAKFKPIKSLAPVAESSACVSPSISSFSGCEHPADEHASQPPSARLASLQRLAISGYSRLDWAARALVGGANGAGALIRPLATPLNPAWPRPGQCPAVGARQLDASNAGDGSNDSSHRPRPTDRGAASNSGSMMQAISFCLAILIMNLLLRLTDSISSCLIDLLSFSTSAPPPAQGSQQHFAARVLQATDEPQHLNR